MLPGHCTKPSYVHAYIRYRHASQPHTTAAPRCSAQCQQMQTATPQPNRTQPNPSRRWCALSALSPSSHGNARATTATTMVSRPQTKTRPTKQDQTKQIADPVSIWYASLSFCSRPEKNAPGSNRHMKKEENRYKQTTLDKRVG